MTFIETYWAYLLITLAISLLTFLAAWFWRGSAMRKESERLRIQLAEEYARREPLEKALSTAEDKTKMLQTENERIKIENARLQEIRAAESEKTLWIQQAEKQMREAFESLAARTLRENAESFGKQAGENIAALLDRANGDWNSHKIELQGMFSPLRENLTRLDGHVRELEQKREGAYQGLSEQIQRLAKANGDMQAAAVTLTQALKSSSVRGRWGEIQLRRVVEMAGMTPHVAFAEQVSVNGRRPDMIIHLPNAGILPVDSKAPLAAYMEAVETDDPSEHKRKMTLHGKAMRDRIRELSKKKYWEQFEATPEFVVMFIPSEGCMSAAFEHDPGLLEFAIGHQILVCTPVTLMALLKSVAYGWKQYQTTENARQIAAIGQELFRRMETFIDRMAELGTHLNRTTESYNRTLGSLERRLMPAARRFQELDLAPSEPEMPKKINIRAREAFGRSPKNEPQDIEF